MKTLKLLASCLMLIGGLESAQAGVIGFEDLIKTGHFKDLGISHSYLGYDWGYGLTAGLAARTFVDSTQGGWWHESLTDPKLVKPPLDVDGSSFAWNVSGSQSLWIDFRDSVSISSIDLAVGSRAYWYQNAKSIQLFGYDANDQLIGISSLLGPGEAFDTFQVSMTGVRYLEIRGDAQYHWFSVDNLAVSAQASPVPLPGAFWLLGSVLTGWGFLNKRRKI